MVRMKESEGRETGGEDGVWSNVGSYEVYDSLMIFSKNRRI